MMAAARNAGTVTMNSVSWGERSPGRDQLIVTPALLHVLKIGYGANIKGKWSLPVCDIMECKLPVIAEAGGGHVGMPDLSRAP
jgi:hypothetical protein